MDDPSHEGRAESLPEDVAALGIWLERLREAADISRTGLAKALGVDRTSLRRWLDGSNEPGGLTLLRLLDALNVRVEPAPHGYFAKSPAGEVRSLRRDLFGYPEDERVKLLERIALGDTDEVKKIAAEMGISQAEVAEIASPEGQRFHGRLGALEATVAALPTAEDLGKAVATLQAAIDRLATAGSHEGQQGLPADTSAAGRG